MTLHARQSQFDLPRHRAAPAPSDAPRALYAIAVLILSLALAGPLAFAPQPRIVQGHAAETDHPVIEDWRGNSAAFRLAP